MTPLYEPDDSPPIRAAPTPLTPLSKLVPFTMSEPGDDALPVLIAVPHAGRAYTGELLAQMRDPQVVMKRLEDRYVDAVALEAMRWVKASLLVAHAPRAMIDLNRSCEDVDWTMVSGRKNGKPQNSLENRRARSGLGLVPRRLLGHGEIWREHLTQEQLDSRIEAIHRPYHQALGKRLAQIRDQWGAALLIDLHSMPPLRARDEAARGAEFVIGDRFGASCDPKIVLKGQEFLQSRGRLVAYNRPYSGGHVLSAHGLPRHGIHALQLEICRSIYLDPELDQPNENLAAIGRLVGELALQLGEEVAVMGRSGFFAQAAE
ncbi:N-formylglutamate amidohydrolase [Altererythrobacter sp. GH1-8]|uniref:N-formylglutamate amidohydrolase n=1 Tax=Altererythrobacter sp. GH1-8 TaxID=3349333 RepID=UPI00374D94A5